MAGDGAVTGHNRDRVAAVTNNLGDEGVAKVLVFYLLAASSAPVTVQAANQCP